MREKLLAAVATVEKDTCYFKPANQVKEKVLQNALNKFAKDCAPEDVVALMDTTFLNSGKDGYLLSTTHFYSNMEKAKLPLAQLRQVELTGKKKDHILLTCADGTATEVFGTIYTQYLYKVMRAVIAAVQQDAPAVEDVTAPKEYRVQPTMPTDGEMAEEQRRMAQAEGRSLEEEFALQQQIVMALQETQWALIHNDAAAALASCVRAAELGDVDGQKMAAGMYEAGKGTEANPAQALHWYLQAAQQDDTEAQKKGAEFYFNGTGWPVNKAEALVWYKKVAEKGDATAQFNVGAMYSSGLGTAADKAQAFHWFLLAAQQGHSSAQHNVANLYRTGEGTAVNMDESFRWYLQAAEQGIAASQFNVGSLYLGGVGTVADEEKALYWFRKAAEQGHAQAAEMVRQLEAPAEPQIITEEAEEPSVVEKENLTKSECTVDEEKSAKAAAPGQAAEALYQRGKAAIQAKDYQNGLNDLIQAGQQGHADAQSMAGYVYLKWKQDKAQAFYWYSLAAQQNNALAQLYLGEAYRTGSGVAQDYAAAVQWYQRAAEQGDANAQNNLALMYVNGMGVEKNNEAALQWFQKAAAQGHAKAKEMAQRLEQQTVNEKLAKAMEAYEAKDYTTALQLFTELAMRGDAVAQICLGLMYYSGEGTAKDLNQALLWFQKSAAQGDEKAKKMVERVRGELDDLKFADVVKIYEDAYNSDDLEKFESALQTLERAKENGYTNAQRKIEELAQRMYREGISDSSLFLWLLKAAEWGNIEAQASVGHKYLIGRGTEKNIDEALKWLRLAAEQGNEEALALLSLLTLTTEELYQKGKQAVRDEEYKDALEYLRIAAQRNHAEAKTLLLELDKRAEEFYKKGETAYHNGERDLALALIMKACALEHPKAGSLRSDIILMSVIFTPEQEAYNAGNFKKVLEIAKEGKKEAQAFLGLMYYEGKGTSVDWNKALEWFLKAAEQGVPEAQYNAGMLYFQGNHGRGKNHKKAHIWLTKAAEQGHAGARKMLNDEWHEHWEIKK